MLESNHKESVHQMTTRN